MARDRLAAMRAQQQQQQGGPNQYGGNNGYGDHSYPTQQQGYGGAGGYPQQNAYQQQPYQPQQEYAQQGGYGGYASVPAQSQPAQESYEMQQTSYPAGGDADDMRTFFNDVLGVQDAIKEIEQSIGTLGDLHGRALNNIDEASSQRAHAELESLAAQTNANIKGVKATLQRLAQQAHRTQQSAPQDYNTRMTQLNAAKNRFKGAIQSYQAMEQSYRQKYRARAERQYKTIKPEATEDEVQAAVRDMESGGQQQIFANALMNSNRHGEARGALREVQERQEDLRQIMRTMAELAELFSQVDFLLVQQEEQVNQIHTQAENVKTDMEAGVVETNKAKISAAKARKNRKRCAILIVILIIIAAVVAAIAVCTQGTNCGRKGNNGGGNPARRSLLEFSDDWSRASIERAFTDMSAFIEPLD
ncbi:hypothetical protein OC834_006244 [Tilletia horrida]|uniref:t-SNARE coiled-coil homology domain-containing protein n=1 Tax=Tilletia horrida TaxID=155126 RepID=A0AAN6G8U3_9BASI|nr:hypothetical protein OC834_006244 [Tilletia horrida]KAK0523560.1 hypothetical protein OC842_006108 [Tilletia horrida]KAK0529590.1 hypothetical protein OC835_004291 [Tilletia horrida]KAK0558389.1 hypothetical protein OC844_005191 [Tilletia horrida]